MKRVENKALAEKILSFTHDAVLAFCLLLCCLGVAAYLLLLGFLIWVKPVIGIPVAVVLTIGPLWAGAYQWAKEETNNP